MFDEAVHEIKRLIMIKTTVLGDINRWNRMLGKLKGLINIRSGVDFLNSIGFGYMELYFNNIRVKSDNFNVVLCTYLLLSNKVSNDLVCYHMARSPITIIIENDASIMQNKVIEYTASMGSFIKGDRNICVIVISRKEAFVMIDGGVLREVISNENDFLRLLKKLIIHIVKSKFKEVE